METLNQLNVTATYEDTLKFIRNKIRDIKKMKTAEEMLFEIFVKAEQHDSFVELAAFIFGKTTNDVRADLTKGGCRNE